MSVLKKVKVKLYNELLNLKGKPIKGIYLWQNGEENLLKFPIVSHIIISRGIFKRVPNVDFISVFGKREELNEKLRKDSVKIFFTGEECNERMTSYKDYLNDVADLSLGFNYEQDQIMGPKTKYMRIAFGNMLFFRGNSFFHRKLNKDFIKKEVDKFNAIKNNRNADFAALISRHDWNGHRQELFDILSKVGKVSCAGDFLHNDDRLMQKYNDSKIEYLKNFMFCICPENQNVKGYVTEKIYDAFRAGTIPLYSGGGDLPDPELINQKAFVKYTGNNKVEVLEQVKELYTNDNYYKEFIKQPRLHDGAVDYLYERQKLFMEMIKEVLEKKS